MKTIYVIEKPHDEFGNIGYHRGIWATDYDGKLFPVIEGEIVVPDDRYPSSRLLSVYEPTEIREKWPRVSMYYLVEVQGPARWLDREEQQELWTELGLWKEGQAA